ncbi:FAD-dependent oxidoreductase [Nocardioides sp. GXZ039]|uniref:FAD-dependent oxidoreductase n=1 Tax=Nocardioides sp. GXZ039 TaxID=3136018 RepID=UPI0030F49102
MTTDLQTIVIGAGALGSATAYWLTERGQADVLLLDQYDLGHGRGASVDHHRAIRHSYHDNKYGRLTAAAFANWDRLVAESGVPVLVRTGGVEIGLEGTSGEDTIHRYRKILEDNGHPYEAWRNAELAERFPQWSVPEPALITHQPDMGFVDIGKAGQVHRALAAAGGATLRGNAKVTALESLPDGVRVHLADGETLTAQKVVVSAGAWADELLGPLGQTWTTTVSQEQVAYVVPRDLRAFTPDRFAVWGWYGPQLLYGFPVYGEVAIKLARDMSGRFVTTETRSFEPVQEETAMLMDFLEQRLPDAAGFELLSKTCIYDMPPDRDFILDTMPGHPRVIVGNGAGHAAKFAGLLGEILSELVVEERSSYRIDAFGVDRPGLTDPGFVPVFGL